jgi:hypothetical protein
VGSRWLRFAHAVDVGVLGQALESARSDGFEDHARARREVANSAACQYLSGSGLRTDSRSDVNGHAAPLFPALLAFADMNAHADTRELVAGCEQRIAELSGLLPAS